ncbi:ion transporter [Chondrinema litorale]|uniref:ion transporter n=1 Tax=Chondrinema litorale TaxID=2994555 RepID=UPI0025436808|nr:ion transporter [Chondrinema litorale]UZR95804.1 ion transporter [Chondrinema litorale]
MNKNETELSKWRSKVHEIIFEADTFWGKTFDVALILIIIFSVIIVSLESVTSIRVKYGGTLKVLEWIFTFLFTLEYIARVFSVLKPSRYIFSFFGIVDLLSIIPTYLSLFIVGAHSLLVIRTLRLVRIFRIFKLVHFIGEAKQLVTALRASGRKITVFLVTVLCITVIMGTIMYLVEGEENGFTSIPISIYWAIVTLTTVGYGDIAPSTVMGQSIAAFIMIMGYGILAVPTGIVSVELAKTNPDLQMTTQACPNCSAEGHDYDAKFCKKCGSEL